MLGPLNVLLTLNLKLCTQLASSVNEPTNGEEMLHLFHTGEFPMGVGHRVENGWGLTKVAVVLLNGLIW